MRRLLSGLVFCACLGGQAVAGGTAFVGPMAAEALLSDYSEFTGHYHDYQPSPADIESLAAVDRPTTLLVMFGTWCHDSAREVPRLLKLLAAADNPQLTLKLLAVPVSKQLLPQTRDFNLRYTPTIVVLRDGVELGRIIERPRQSLAGDLRQILADAADDKRPG